MASTNYLQWNPAQNNQETDSDYLADSQRLSGAVNPEFFDAKLANKLFYQLTTFATAFAEAAVNLGDNFDDTSLSTLTSTIEGLLSGGAIKPDMISVPFSTHLVFDCNLANGFAVTLTANFSFDFANKNPLQPITLAFTQDGTGSHTVTFPADCHGTGSVDPTANSVNIQKFRIMTDSSVHAETPMTSS